VSYPYPPPPPPLPGMYIPPHMYHPGAPRPPQRSAIPKVVGILAIVFACFGALFALVIHFGPLSDLNRWGVSRQAPALVNWMWGSLALSAGVFALHMIGGITALMYRPVAPRLVTAYAILAILLAISDIVLSTMLVPANLRFDTYSYLSVAQVKESMMVRAVIEGLCIPWPVVALALMNTRGAKHACGAVAT
jgi:hypothetical protein